MLMHWAHSHPIQLAALCLGGIALIVVLVDFLRYFGYYVRDHWTEAFWIDDLAGRNDRPAAIDHEKDGAAERTHK